MIDRDGPAQGTGDNAQSFALMSLPSYYRIYPKYIVGVLIGGVTYLLMILPFYVISARQDPFPFLVLGGF